MADPLSRERLVKEVDELLAFQKSVENTWQQTVGKIDLLKKLLVELDAQPKEGSP